MCNLTIRQAVDKRGGLAKVAGEHGVTPKAVSNWQVWNRLPERVHYSFAEAMADLGYPDFDPRNPASVQKRSTDTDSSEEADLLSGEAA